jgi:glycosyltransferase involved in cell wall biosynthesis
LNPVGSQVVIENPDDYSALLENRLVRKENLNLIKGAGVNVEVFNETPEQDGPLTVVLIARMLRDKGVGEFVESARQLKPRFPEVRFLLVGSPDSGNPTSFSISDLNSWQREGCVEWIGHSSDVANILKQSHIVCLPSYREGLPKSLIEAASVGRPIVTTNVPGCREVVSDGENGFLVPPRDSLALADAIEKLLIDPPMRKAMGAVGGKRAVEEFSSAVIIRQTLDLYESIQIP